MYRIVLLRDDHALDKFDCGDARKNDWLQKYALQNTKGGLGRTYVAVKLPDERTVYGYYTISSSSVKFENPPQGPSHPIPASGNLDRQTCFC